jgi:hypothetical protein
MGQRNDRQAPGSIAENEIIKIKLNMKTKLTSKMKLAALAISLAACAPQLFAQLNIPSDGSDGALVISSDTVIDLSQAVTGNWTNNNSANAGQGIYDPNKWAVVFKYSSVVIANGATLTFSNHPTHAPVVWLVSGDVTVNGAISLDGRYSILNYTNTAEPGPGGFRGGNIVMSGFGPGGGYDSGNYAFGYYSTTHAYGNQQIVPLIGGSGAGAGYFGSYSAGGGGAILIASSGTININGSVHANAGVVYYNPPTAVYYAAGGAIRLIAGQISGNGSIAVSGYDPGRFRLEATNIGYFNISIPGNGTPQDVVVSPFPLTIWPATNAPTVQVTTISNVDANLTAPVDPKAALGAGGDDLAIATKTAVMIGLQTFNFPTNGTVNVYIKSLYNGQTVLPASCISGNSNSASWQLVTTLPLNHTVIQARAIY